LELEVESGEFFKIFKKYQNQVAKNPKNMKYFHLEEQIKKIKEKKSPVSMLSNNKTSYMYQCLLIL
jgi:hypothetical protein